MRKSLLSLVVLTFLAAGAHAQIAQQMEQRFIGQMLGNKVANKISERLINLCDGKIKELEGAAKPLRDKIDAIEKRIKEIKKELTMDR